MSLKTPIKKKAVKNHFAYGWWKYALLIIVAVFGWDLIYTSTAYRPPEDKKVLFYVSASSGDSEKIDEYMAQVQQKDMEDMEEMSSVVLLGSGGESDPYSTMQLSVYIMAGEGDLYLLPHDTFANYALQGAFLPLDDYILEDKLMLPPGDMGNYRFVIEEMEEEIKDVNTTEKEIEEGKEPFLYGIPADELYGLLDFSIDPRNMVLCVLYNNQNNENTVKFLNHVLKDQKKEAPKWFLEVLEKEQGLLEDTK